MVVIILDGIMVEFFFVFDVEFFLDGVLKVGVDLFFVCKGGVCSICCVKLIEGEVEMDVNYVLEFDELVVGYIFICQVYFKMDWVVVDFDS